MRALNCARPRARLQNGLALYLVERGANRARSAHLYTARGCSWLLEQRCRRRRPECPAMTTASTARHLMDKSLGGELLEVFDSRPQ